MPIWEVGFVTFSNDGAKENHVFLEALSRQEIARFLSETCGYCVADKLITVELNESPDQVINCSKVLSDLANAHEEVSRLALAKVALGQESAQLDRDLALACQQVSRLVDWYRHN
jgi:hypothetical protein